MPPQQAWDATSCVAVVCTAAHERAWGVGEVVRVVEEWGAELK